MDEEANVYNQKQYAEGPVQGNRDCVIQTCESRQRTSTMPLTY